MVVQIGSRNYIVSHRKPSYVDVVKKHALPLTCTNAAPVQNPKTWRPRILVFDRLGRNANISFHSVSRRSLFDRIQMDFNRVEEAKNTRNQWQSSEIPDHSIQCP
jgi:hypothetical protein